MSEKALAVLRNLERYMLDGQVIDILRELDIEPDSSREFELSIKVERAYKQGVELGDDLALLAFLDMRTRDLARNRTGAQAELLGVGSASEKKACNNMRQIKSGVHRGTRGIPAGYRDHLFQQFSDDIQMPNLFAEWANGMTAAVQFLHDAGDRPSDSLLPKLSPLWFASAFLALSTSTWIKQLQSGPAESAFVLGQRCVSNAAKGLEMGGEVNLTHGILLYPMCRTYSEAIALSLYLLPHRRVRGNT